MTTNLIFKRVVNNNGINETEMKIVPVFIPEIPANEGWTLASCADKVAIVPPPEYNSDGILVPEKPEVKEIRFGEKFECPFPGTAQLVRTQKSIFITYRHNNETSPNAVGIDDSSKNLFFNDFRRTGSGKNYTFPANHSQYKYWSNFIDAEYKRQLETVNKKLNS